MKHNESNAPKYRRSLLRIITVVTYILAMLFIGVSAQAQAASQAKKSAQTIVLLHGAWADSAGWNGVTSRLQADGYKVWAVPNPLRGLSSDAAYVASILKSIPGPIILVAHSYGGAVITNAATGNPNVKALVYIDGFAPDEGETGYQLLGMPPPPGASPSCLLETI
jgi:pimeloyl-ACP methyl ester carboxylesterase